MKISGWHGSPKKIHEPFRGSCSSEGCGVYFSTSKAFASYFGRPNRIEARILSPLVVDNEDMPALEGNLYEGYLTQGLDSVWIRANYAAAKQCGLFEIDKERDPEAYVQILFGCFGAALTSYLKRHGYDSILFKIRSERLPERFQGNPAIEGTEISWWVVFDPEKVTLV